VQEKRAFILRSKTTPFDAQKTQENSLRKSTQGSSPRLFFSGTACYSFTHESLPHPKKLNDLLVRIPEIQARQSRAWRMAQRKNA
jgi:hypothetical protein